MAPTVVVVAVVAAAAINPNGKIDEKSNPIRWHLGDKTLFLGGHLSGP